jgi:sec-independent protein translocase protein TatA
MIGTPELIIVLVVVLVIFGGTQLPKLARGLGQAQREFKKGLDEGAPEKGEAEKGEGRKSAESDTKRDDEHRDST